jgi:hypothetical protein
MYCVLEQELDRTPAYTLAPIPAETKPSRRWTDGARLTAPPALPLELELDEAFGTGLPDFLDGDIPVFSHRLLQRLVSEGVDNLDAYPAVLTDAGRGRRWDGYFAVNVIGAVRCADMDQSHFSDPAGQGVISLGFRRLVLDAGRAGGLLCFRLLESLPTILIEQRLAERVRGGGFMGVRFTRVGSAA